MEEKYQDPSMEDRIAFVLDAWKDQNVAPPAYIAPKDGVDMGHTAIAAYAMRKIWDGKHRKAK